MRTLLLALFVFGALCGCRDVRTTARQFEGSCAPSPNVASAPGASCDSAQNCTEVCCVCPSSGKRFTAAACIDQACGAFEDTCDSALGEQPSLCEN